MDITIPITIPDYLYDFYKTGAAQLQRESPEEMMATALEQYAGIVAIELLKAKGISFGDDNETIL